jgi:hypothetical protein
MVIIMMVMNGGVKEDYLPYLSNYNVSIDTTEREIGLHLFLIDFGG